MGINNPTTLNEQMQYICLALNHICSFSKRFYVFESQNMD